MLYKKSYTCKQSSECLGYSSTDCERTNDKVCVQIRLCTEENPRMELILLVTFQSGSRLNMFNFMDQKTNLQPVMLNVHLIIFLSLHNTFDFNFNSAFCYVAE